MRIIGLVNRKRKSDLYYCICGDEHKTTAEFANVMQLSNIFKRENNIHDSTAINDTNLNL